MKKIILPGLLIGLFMVSGCKGEQDPDYIVPKLKRPITVKEAEVMTPAATIIPTPEPEPTPEPTPEPEPEIVPEDPEPIVEEIPEPVETYEDVETGDLLPTPADELGYQDHEYIGTYTVAWYSAEETGNSIGAAENGLIAGYSCAMPDYSLLNCTILIEGYGYYHVDDISPDGVADIFVNSNADIPSYGMDLANVYIVR